MYLILLRQKKEKCKEVKRELLISFEPQRRNNLFKNRFTARCIQYTEYELIGLKKNGKYIRKKRINYYGKNSKLILVKKEKIYYNTDYIVVIIKYKS